MTESNPPQLPSYFVNEKDLIIRDDDVHLYNYVSPRPKNRSMKTILKARKTLTVCGQMEDRSARHEDTSDDIPTFNIDNNDNQRTTNERMNFWMNE